jgi:hypothetical protein
MECPVLRVKKPIKWIAQRTGAITITLSDQYHTVETFFLYEINVKGHCKIFRNYLLVLSSKDLVKQDESTDNFTSSSTPALIIIISFSFFS